MRRNKGFYFPQHVGGHDFLVCMLFEYAPAAKFNYRITIKIGDHRPLILHSDDRTVPTKKDALYYLRILLPEIIASEKTIT